MKSLFITLLLCLALPASATEVAGVNFEPAAKVAESALTLNGAGLRNRLFIKVYAIGLYLPQKTGNAADVLAQKGAKRVAIVTLRDLSAEQFADALIEALQKNHDEAALAPLRERLEQFRARMLELKQAPEKTVVHLDWLPETGTRMSVNGAAKGAPIAGEDFYRALLRIWLGPQPAQDDLKDKLLGKAG
jgi:hypothetical protein